MSTEFDFPFTGNKHSEFKFIEPYLPFIKGIETVAEPFAGTLAVSYNIYKEQVNKLRYVSSDSDSFLVTFYDIIKQVSKQQLLKSLQRFT